MPSTNLDIIVFEQVARQDASLKWYAIADSAQHYALPEALVFDGNKVRCLFGATQGSPVSQKSPHLVQLDSPSSGHPVWSWISLHAKSKPCLTVIATALPFDTLFSQLANCMEVLLPDSFAMFFGFWDPAILGALMGQPDDMTLHVKGPVLERDQRLLLTQGLSAWWYWDREGKIHQITEGEIAKSSLTAPIALDQRQVDDLVEASVPDQVLYYLELNQPRILSDVPVRERYDHVRQALVKARGIGLLTMHDLVNFVCIDILYMERMRDDGIILNLLDEIKCGRITFNEALERLP
ncbi:MAG TPA: DUF4123 domain-containing protein [Telluria sp.]